MSHHFVWLVCMAIICLCLPKATYTLSDKRLCADPKCESIISTGTTKLSYNAPEKGMVSFKINSAVRVLSKSAGSDLRLWGVEVNGRRGFVNKDFILEKKVLIRENELKHELPVSLPITVTSSEPPLPTTSPLASMETPISNASQGDIAVNTMPLKSEPVFQTTDFGEDTPTSVKTVIEVLSSEVQAQDANQNEVSNKKNENETEIISDKNGVDNNDSHLNQDDNSTTNEIENNEPQNNFNTAEKDLVDNKHVTEFSNDRTEATDVKPEVDAANELQRTEEILVAMEERQKELPVGILSTAKNVKAHNAEESTPSELKSEVASQIKSNSGEEDLLDTVNRNNKLASELPNSHNSPVAEITEPKPEMATVDKLQQNEAVLNETEKGKEEFLVEKPSTANNIKGRDARESSLNELESEAASQIKSNSGGKDLLDKVNENNKLVEATEVKSEVDAENESTQTEEFASTTEDKQQELPFKSLSHTNIVKTHMNMESEPAELLSEVASQENLNTFLQNGVKDMNASEQTNSDDVKTKDTFVSMPTHSSDQHLLKYTNPDNSDKEKIESKTVESVANEINTADTILDTETQEDLENNLSNETKLEIPKISHIEEAKKVDSETKDKHFSTISNGPVSVDITGNENEKKVTLLKELVKPRIEDVAVKEISDVSDIEVPTLSPNLPPLVYQDNQDSSDKYKLYHEQQNMPLLSSESFAKETQNALTGSIQHSLMKEVDSEINHQQNIPHNNDHQLPSSVEAKDRSPSYFTEYATPAQNTLVSTNDKPLENDLSSHNEFDLVSEITSQQTSSNSNSESSEIFGTEISESLEKFEKQTTSPSAVPLQSLDSDSSLKDGSDGLFATILGTVNEFLSTNKKNSNQKEELYAEQSVNKYGAAGMSRNTYQDAEFCSRIQAETCGKFPFGLAEFLELFAVRALDHSELIVCIIVAAVSTLFFVFGYYCFWNKSNESTLVSKLNLLERSFLAKMKENTILYNDLTSTRSKLASIEDSSFGSNDMVASLMKELELEQLDKEKLHHQVKSLEKDLILAADAGLELNTYVSELLSNQNGDESIKDTVEELQRQLNEQDQTIRDINASLAEKSRENSELQLSLAEQNARLTSDLSIIQQDNNELEIEKANLQSHIEELKSDFSQNFKKTLESKNYEIQKIQNHTIELTSKWEQEHSELQTSLAKIEALEDCLKTLKRDSTTNIEELIVTARLQGELTAVQKKYATLKARLNSEIESKRISENQVKSFSDEIEKLKKDYNQSEKDKLDAQTRLEVLSNYFKEKEAQLQKELSVKEAMWLKQQGEKTGTVDKITGLQEEIQILKSQNDELRAEIEAQVASHKAQTGILQSRLHEHYLAARQAERRYDEARNEAALLRSHLTAIAATNNSVTAANSDQMSNASGNETQNKADLKDAPSPIPGSPFFPPPLPFLPPQGFLTSPQFMGLPPPPTYLPPPENLRPAPLGRIKSPTSRSDRYSPLRSSRRYSPQRHNEEYSDYDDDDYYDDIFEDDRISRSYRRRRSWQRDNYSPPPTNYSFSPAESRYNCADTETDFSPPESPRSNRASPPRSNQEV